VVAGRDIKDDDRSSSVPAALVNEAFVKRFLPNTNPLGHRVDAGRGMATIVGVLHDGKYGSVDEPLHPVVYVPVTQWFSPSLTIHVRTAGAPKAILEAVRRTLLSIHVDIPTLQPRTLAEHISSATFTQRTGASVLGAFAVVALVLSVIGLYGALAFSVALRSRELAIRTALGAGRTNVAWMVARQALVIAGGGIVGGSILSVFGGNLLRAQVRGVSAGSVVSYVLAALALIAAALISAWIPARRALRVDPAVALRDE
jgi:hypothetical protein